MEKINIITLPDGTKCKYIESVGPNRNKAIYPIAKDFTITLDGNRINCAQFIQENECYLRYTNMSPNGKTVWLLRVKI